MRDTATEDLVRVGEALSEYVSLGALREGDEFDGRFAEMDRLVPPALRRAPAHAYRVLALAAEDHARLVSSGELRLRHRAYGSWTADRDASRMLLRGRVASAPEGKVVVVVRKPVPPEAVVADVQAIYRALRWDVGEMECWSRYASWERELILRQDAELLTLPAGEVVATHLPRDLAVMAPIPGESAWDEASDGLLEVVDVPEAQPHADEGVWLVETADGAARAIAWNARVGAWDVAPVPGPTPGR